MRRNKSEHIDIPRLRSAVRGVVEADRFDEWLVELPDDVLIQVAAPLEMLQFQYYLSPTRDRHLVRAARVCCEAVEGGLERCPADMVAAFGNLTELLAIGGR